MVRPEEVIQGLRNCVRGGGWQLEEFISFFGKGSVEGIDFNTITAGDIQEGVEHRVSGRGDLLSLDEILKKYREEGIDWLSISDELLIESFERGIETGNPLLIRQLFEKLQSVGRVLDLSSVSADSVVLGFRQLVFTETKRQKLTEFSEALKLIKIEIPVHHEDTKRMLTSTMKALLFAMCIKELQSLVSNLDAVNYPVQELFASIGDVDLARPVVEMFVDYDLEGLARFFNMLGIVKREINWEVAPALILPSLCNMMLAYHTSLELFELKIRYGLPIDPLDFAEDDKR